MTVCVLAGVSVRAMAEAMADAGFDLVALDVFGDRDTRRWCRDWISVAPAAGPPRLSAQPLLSALASLSARADVAGWIAGSGFEADPGLLGRAARLLPLVGCAPEVVQRLREPSAFFALLDALRIAHPEVRFRPPAAPAGWLMKDARGTGGWAVRPAADAGRANDAALPGIRPPGEGGAGDEGGDAVWRYWQRQAPGQAMSACFVADGRQAVVLGHNRLLSRRFGRRPYVYCGAIGPVPLAPEVEAEVQRSVDALVWATGLVGLASLDFLLDREALTVLECNPRPSASLELYRDRLPGGPMQAHWAACRHGRLPARPDPGAASDDVSGTRILFTRRPMALSAPAADWLAAQADLRDLPAAGLRFAAGDPLCSLVARDRDADAVQARMRQRRRELLEHLETFR